LIMVLEWSGMQIIVCVMSVKALVDIVVMSQVQGNSLAFARMDLFHIHVDHQVSTYSIGT
jgi:hypothetical protein